LLVVVTGQGVHSRTIREVPVGHWWLREVGRAPARNTGRQRNALSKSPSRHIRSQDYGPKTLAVMDEAFAATWNVLKADDPFRDSYDDRELRIAIGHKLMTLWRMG
jgi:hypothetical protein